MNSVFLLTEDVYLLKWKFFTLVTSVHSTIESAELEFNSHFVKNGLIDGYHIHSDDAMQNRHRMVMKKWFGLTSLAIEVKQVSVIEKKNDFG
jgi:hypothetical protein